MILDPFSAISTPAKIRFGSKKIPVQLVFGGPAKAEGSLIGLGVDMGGRRQLVRMDYHTPAADHGKKRGGVLANEIAYWVWQENNNYHTHVRKWNAREQ